MRYKIYFCRIFNPFESLEETCTVMEIKNSHDFSYAKLKSWYQQTTTTNMATCSSLKGVSLGYGKQASWQHWMFTLDMGSFKKKWLFFFLPSYSCAPCFFLYLIAANKTVLLLCACGHKISLKYVFTEKIVIEICC